MSPRVEYAQPGTVTPPQWAGQPIHSGDLYPGGAKIDATAFTTYASDVTVTTAADVTVNVTTTALAEDTNTTIAVAALSAAIPSGTVLTFNGGQTATLSAQANQGATSLTVTALAADIPSASTATYSNPGVAPAGATSIRVAALSNALPGGTMLSFGGGIFALLTQNAAQSTTTLTVAPLVQAVPASSSAFFKGFPAPRIPSGTLVGRTWAERANGDPFGPLDASDNEIGIVAFGIPDVRQNNDVDLVKPTKSFSVHENYLPGYTGFSGPILALVRANYNSILGR